TLLDAAGGELAFNNDSSGTRNSTVVSDVAAGLTYYVRAGAFSNSSTGRYTLSFAMVADGADDFDDILAEAHLIALDGFGTGSIEAAGDVDYFKIVLYVPGRLTARVQAQVGATRLSLLGPDG